MPFRAEAGSKAQAQIKSPTRTVLKKAHQGESSNLIKKGSELNILLEGNLTYTIDTGSQKAHISKSSKLV